MLISCRKRRLLVTPLLALLTVLVAPWLAASQSTEATDFRLAEIDSFRLPDGFVPAGVSISSDGDLAALADPGWGIVVLDVGSGTVVPVESAAPLNPMGVRFLDRSTLEVIGVQVGILKMSLDGTISESEPLCTPLMVESAIPWEPAWVIGGRDASGSYRIIIRDKGKCEAFTPACQLPSFGESSWRLARFNDRLMIAEFGSPLRLLAATPGHDSTACQRFRAPRLDELFDSTSEVVSSATFKVNGFVANSLVDLRSDRRVILLYDSAGNVHSMGAYELPVGFVGAIGENVLGYRNFGYPELVLYRFEHPHQTEGEHSTPSQGREG